MSSSSRASSACRSARCVTRGKEVSTTKAMCGVFGICAANNIDVANVTYFGLFALQHRGQESAGIAVADGDTVRVHRGMGLVAQVFSPASVRAMGEGSILPLSPRRHSNPLSTRAEKD